MSKLSETQIRILTSAAAADTGAVDAPQDSKPAVAGLVKRALVIVAPRANGPNQLVITVKGREAIGGEPDGATGNASPVTLPSTPPVGPTGPTVGSGKLGSLVALLKRPQGATIDEMMAATGWQAHSVRGAMAGSLKKAHGQKISSDKVEGVRTYRITIGDAA